MTLIETYKDALPHTFPTTFIGGLIGGSGILIYSGKLNIEAIPQIIGLATIVALLYTGMLAVIDWLIRKNRAVESERLDLKNKEEEQHRKFVKEIERLTQ